MNIQIIEQIQNRLIRNKIPRNAGIHRDSEIRNSVAVVRRHNKSGSVNLCYRFKAVYRLATKNRNLLVRFFSRFINLAITNLQNQYDFDQESLGNLQSIHLQQMLEDTMLQRENQVPMLKIQSYLQYYAVFFSCFLHKQYDGSTYHFIKEQYCLDTVKNSNCVQLQQSV